MDPSLAFAFVALSALALAGASSYLAHRSHAAQRAEWAAEKKQLLDRVMATDYREYRALDGRGRTGVRVLTDAQEKAAAERQSGTAN